jgi:hypothetical protein
VNQRNRSVKIHAAIFSEFLWTVANRITCEKTMNTCWKMPLFVFALSLGSLTAAAAAQLTAPIPEAIATPGLTTAAFLRAEGVQVYECKPASDSKLAWQFREPIATLMFAGSTVGRHYAGLRWEHIDGSVVQAKSAGSASGAAQDDIPWLRFEVVDHRGNGALSGVTQVQRINTQGGVARGPCEVEGSFRSVPYSADYVFLKKD